MAKRREKGDGSISRRKDGRWEGRLYIDTPDGKRRRVVYGKTKTEVREKLKKVSSEPVHMRAKVENPTLSAFLAQYSDVVRTRMKTRSFETYEEIARLHLIPAFGGCKLRSMDRASVQRLYAEKLDSGLSPARVRRIHGVLSAALNHALRWGLVEKNICAEVTPPRVPAPEIRPFSAEEAKRFLTASRDDRFHALYVLGIATGLRSGELGGLFWSDLDLKRRVVRVQRSLITGRMGQCLEPPKTPASRRSVGLTIAAVEALREHSMRQKSEGLTARGDEHVFTNTTGGPINPSHLFCRSFKTILKRASLPKTTFHAATRHTFCCLALGQGVNAKTVSLAMGHSSVAFTLQKYASFLPSYEDTAVALENALQC